MTNWRLFSVHFGPTVLSVIYFQAFWHPTVEKLSSSYFSWTALVPWALPSCREAINSFKHFKLQSIINPYRQALPLAPFTCKLYKLWKTELKLSMETSGKMWAGLELEIRYCWITSAKPFIHPFSFHCHKIEPDFSTKNREKTRHGGKITKDSAS